MEERRHYNTLNKLVLLLFFIINIAFIVSVKLNNSQILEYQTFFV